MGGGEFRSRSAALLGHETPQRDRLTRAVAGALHEIDADLESSRAATDLLIQPTPDGIDIRDWKGFEPGVEAGYRATREALEGLDRPVTHLRRRAPFSASAPPDTDGETASGSSRPGGAEPPRKAARRARREKPSGSGKNGTASQA